MSLRTRLDTFAAVSQSLAEERDQKTKGKAYSAAVIESCEIYLRLNPVHPFTFVEKSIPLGDL